MKTPRFVKRVENFVCLNCGNYVIGNGYTNHCPHCLYSMHVDINPGDRKNSCKGLMKPIGIDRAGGEMKIVHKCVKCGLLKKNRIQKKDNIDVIIDISTNTY